MAEYRFSTIWRVDAPLAAVWDAIYQVDRWPDWWKGAVRTVEIESGDARGVGALHRYTWKGALPYRLTFDMRVRRVEPPHVLEGRERRDRRRRMLVVHCRRRPYDRAL